MARKRTIDPDLWTDDAVTSLKDVRSYVVYIGAISQADDYGRLEWSARQLWAKLFPTREDVRVADVERWMTDVVDAKLVTTYEVGGRTYAFHPNWARHQYVNRPSKSRIPSPPQPAQHTESVRTDSERIPEPTQKVSSASVSVSVSVSDTSLRDGSHAPTPEETLSTSADELSLFLLDEGVELGIIGLHHAGNRDRRCINDRENALKLVGTYGLDACKLRARAMLAAMNKNPRLRRGDVSVATLCQMWDYRELGDVVKTAAEDDFIADLRRETA